MKKTLILFALAMAACNDDGPAGLECGAGTVEMNGECVSTGPTCGTGTMLMNNMCVPTPGPQATFKQIEHLARPGINEALLISDGFHAAYNATAPAFAGVPPADLAAVTAEAKTVLKALYLGACLLNGAAGLPADGGFKPAGVTCHAVGPALWTENTLAGVTLTQASKDAAQAYADTVFGLFIQDVMRVDTAVTSNYATFCGGTSPVGLCGGRFVRDDTIDITFDFLLNGARTCSVGLGGGTSLCGAPNQVNAIVSDGVSFFPTDATKTAEQRIAGDPTNRQQGHPDVSNTFPYSAPPL